ncbi:hypothetical protein BKA64DRAFT_709696 [Cadophora sp. MPI-SDFR-AT-0126]|nr:hypothetical protein BKA64DRAFT_709696 [Leotiomycetes sp. MPI-SDFR-AT-0126]
MSLLALSNELLLEIISDLEGSTTSISRCTRQLHEIAEPVLYASVNLNHPKSYTRFIQTIVRNPCLAGYVKHFRTVGHPYGWDFDLSFLTVEDRVWIRSQFPNSIHDKPTCDAWFKKMFLSSDTNWFDVPKFWDTITAFFLTLFAPRLQTVRIDSYGWNVDRYQYIDMVLNSASKLSDSFRDLKKVTLMACTRGDYSIGPSPLPVHLLISYLQVPSVIQFKASNVSLVRNPTTTAFHIKDLTLSGCRLTGSSLTSFLLCFRSLRRLKFYDAAPDHTILAASNLCRGLANSTATLEELILVHAPGESDSWPGEHSSTNDEESGFDVSDGADTEGPRTNVLGSLRSFLTLKTLHIESAFLLAFDMGRRAPQTVSEPGYHVNERDRVALADCFPASLEQLTLNISPRLHCYVLQILSQGIFLNNTPSFKSLHLLFRHHIGNDKPIKPVVGRLEELRDLAKVNGVELSWDCLCQLSMPFQCYEEYENNWKNQVS